MSYTNRLKICIFADIFFLIDLLIVGLLFLSNIIDHDVLWVCSSGAFVILLLVWYFRDYGKYKKWRNIWKDPIWYKVSYIIMAVAILLFFFKNLETEKMSIAMMILVLITQIVLDTRYFINAMKYDMDDLEDVNELARRFPEARPYINRKEKGDR